MQIIRRSIPANLSIRFLVIAGWLCSIGNTAAAQQSWVDEAIDSQRQKSNRSLTRKRPTQDRVDSFASRNILASRRTLRTLDQATAKFQRILRAGGWPRLPKGKTLKLGDRGKGVDVLIQRLTAAGDLASSRTTTFDKAVEEAVMRFQWRHGLTPKGRVNSFTRSALNVTAKHRLDQLLHNRRRVSDLLPRTDGRRYILVNIPSYELQAVNGSRLEIYSRVILGKPTTPTPVLSAKVRALNTLPYWHVPQSIAKRQLIPALMKDPNYLDRQKIRVFASWGGVEIDPRSINWWAPQGQRFVFRQEPGPHNALGLLRLDMPNKDIVYMHDTPLKKLYNYQLRPYSAGCVRVQTVFDVGEWLLHGDRNPAAGRLRQIIRSGQKETLKLAEPVDVHFVYISAWVGKDGTVHFRPDIYRKDGRIIQKTNVSGWAVQTTSPMP